MDEDATRFERERASRWQAAAQALLARRRARRPIAPLPPALRPRDLAEGYAVQQALRPLLEAAGLGPPVGHKIGCTTPVMQAFLGIPHPCAGRIHAAGVLHGAGTVPHRGFLRVGVECEIAVRLGEDLAPGAGVVPDRARVEAAVEAVLPAIEIVDDRYRDYRTLGVPTLVADDFFHSGCVLGEPRRDWRALDLAAARGVTWVDGVEAGRGTGASVMGHPMEALAWLAGMRAGHGLPPLRRGEVVLLGSLVQTVWLAPGTRARIEIEGLGAAELEVEG